MDPSILLHPSKWCTPAIIYGLFSLAVVLILVFVMGAIPNIPKWKITLLVVALMAIMIYLMQYLCSVGLEWVSWVLLLFPMVSGAFTKNRGVW